MCGGNSGGGGGGRFREGKLIILERRCRERGQRRLAEQFFSVESSRPKRRADVEGWEQPLKTRFAFATPATPFPPAIKVRSLQRERRAQGGSLRRIPKK